MDTTWESLCYATFVEGGEKKTKTKKHHSFIRHNETGQALFHQSALEKTKRVWSLSFKQRLSERFLLGQMAGM